MVKEKTRFSEMLIFFLPCIIIILMHFIVKYINRVYFEQD